MILQYEIHNSNQISFHTFSTNKDMKTPESRMNKIYFVINNKRNIRVQHKFLLIAIM